MREILGRTCERFRKRHRRHKEERKTKNNDEGLGRTHETVWKDQSPTMERKTLKIMTEILRRTREKV